MTTHRPNGKKSKDKPLKLKITVHGDTLTWTPGPDTQEHLRRVTADAPDKLEQLKESLAFATSMVLTDASIFLAQASEDLNTHETKSKTADDAFSIGFSDGVFFGIDPDVELPPSDDMEDPFKDILDLLRGLLGDQH